MSSRLQLILIATVLCAAGLGHAIYKSRVYGFPFLPGAKDAVWVVQAQVKFKRAAAASQALLSKPVLGEYSILNASQTGRGFVAFEDEVDGRRVVGWRSDKTPEDVRLYYRIDLAASPTSRPVVPAGDLATEHFVLEGAERGAVDELASECGDPGERDAFVEALAKRLGADTPAGAAALLLAAKPGVQRKINVARAVLSSAGIPARAALGIYLVDGHRGRKPVPALLVEHGDGWRVLHSRSSKKDAPPLLLWTVGTPLLDVEGGQSSAVTFSVQRTVRAVAKVAALRESGGGGFMSKYSLYSLPLAHQNAFKLLLLVPIGAFIVVVLRNVVGLPSTGTFLPVLLALSFRDTHLLPGITIFVVVVGIGLAIRGWLSRLNLLLVPRISAVVVVVILIMLSLTILAVRTNMLDPNSVTLFPTIIVAWTIERLSVLWEESGPREVAIRGSGMLIVAIVAYLVMSNTLVEHLSFTFPELILLVLAGILFVGQYNGYRLSELRRFEPLVTSAADSGAGRKSE